MKEGARHPDQPQEAPSLQARLPIAFTGPLLTSRLTLRVLEAGDVDDVFAYQSREDVCRYNIGFEPRSRDEVIDAIAKQSANRRVSEQFVKLVIERRDCPGRVIGEVMLALVHIEHAEGEIGWTLHPDHCGQGYATEALVALIDAAFGEIGFHRLTALIDTRNQRSLAMASRLGMRPEGRFIEAQWSRGAWRDMVLYALLSVEWRASARESARRLQTK